MTYSEMGRKIQTAGTWFVGSFMGEILLHYLECCDDVEKKLSFIEYMHKEYGEALEYTYDTTKTKCYAVFSIIKEQKVVEALDYVLQSNDKKVFDGGKENAQAVLDSIRDGKYKLPY